MPVIKLPGSIQIAVFAFLGLQVLAVILGLFQDEKHFNWVPYDELSTYKIEVSINDTLLSHKSVHLRYRRPAQHRENRSIHNLISLVRRYETTYGRNDRAIVTINYHTNGHSSYSWSWPEDRIQAASPPR